MTKLEENKIGFLIFAFVFEIRPILCPHTSLWGVLATPNQHLLTLPSSSVGKSPGLHAQVQQFNPTQDTCFFFFTHVHAYFRQALAYTCTYTRVLDTHTHTRTRAHLCACVCVCVCVHACGSLHHNTPSHTIRSLLAPPLRTIFLLSVAVACYTLSRKFQRI